MGKFRRTRGAGNPAYLDLWREYPQQKEKSPGTAGKQTRGNSPVSSDARPVSSVVRYGDLPEGLFRPVRRKWYPHKRTKQGAKL